MSDHGFFFSPPFPAPEDAHHGQPRGEAAHHAGPSRGEAVGACESTHGPSSVAGQPFLSSLLLLVQGSSLSFIQGHRRH